MAVPSRTDRTRKSARRLRFSQIGEDSGLSSEGREPSDRQLGVEVKNDLVGDKTSGGLNREDSGLGSGGQDSHEHDIMQVIIFLGFIVDRPAKNSLPLFNLTNLSSDCRVG